MPNAVPTLPHDCVYSVADPDTGRVMELASFSLTVEYQVIEGLRARFPAGSFVNLWGPGELPRATLLYSGRSIEEAAAAMEKSPPASPAAHACDAITFARAAIGALLCDRSTVIGPAQRESLVDLLDDLREHLTACAALAQVRDFPRPHSVEPPAPADPAPGNGALAAADPELARALRAEISRVQLLPAGFGTNEKWQLLTHAANALRRDDLHEMRAHLERLRQIA